jgi:hypothetical protein
MIDMIICSIINQLFENLPLCKIDNYYPIFCDNLLNNLFSYIDIENMCNSIPPPIIAYPIVIIKKKTLQQKLSLYTKWFHWIFSDFTGCSEWGLVKKQWIHWSSERGLVNCTHIF